MRVKIEITQEDINRGISRNPETCPVARALKRVCKRGCSMSVGGKDFSITDNADCVVEVVTSVAVRRFIDKFDNPATRNKCKPFSFTLDMLKADAEKLIKPSCRT